MNNDAIYTEGKPSHFSSYSIGKEEVQFPRANVSWEVALLKTTTLTSSDLMSITVYPTYTNNLQLFPQ